MANIIMSSASTKVRIDPTPRDISNEIEDNFGFVKALSRDVEIVYKALNGKIHYSKATKDRCDRRIMKVLLKMTTELIAQQVQVCLLEKATGKEITKCPKYNRINSDILKLSRKTMKEMFPDGVDIE